MGIKQIIEQFDEDCKDQPIHVGVAVDGSKVSEKAFHTGVHIKTVSPDSSLTVLHVWSSESKDLPMHLRPQHIEHECKTKFLKFRIPEAEFAKAERGLRETTCEALTRLAGREGIDLLVIGAVSGDGDRVNMLGSTADQSLRTSEAHTCMVKSTSYPTESTAKFLVATDLSPCSDWALLTAARYLARSTDSMDVVAFQAEDRPRESSSGATALEDSDLNDIREVLKDAGVAASVQIGTIPRGQSVAQAILDRAHADQVDFIVMGIAGNDGRDVGSVTEAVMKGARCTTFAIKNPHIVQKAKIVGAKSLTQAMVAAGTQLKNMHL